MRRGVAVAAVALVAALAVPAVALAAALAGPAEAQVTALGAQPRDAGAEELGLAVEVGYDGRVAAAAWLPVTVTLDPARPVAGTLVVESRSESGVAREQRRVDVAARTPSAYRFLVPAGPLAVAVHEPGRDAVTVRPSVEPERRVFLAGVLGGVPVNAPAVRHEPTGLPMAWVGFDPAWLDQAPEALEPLDALVVTQGGLDGLADRARRGLAAAVVGGIDLVVVADRPGPVEVAPGLAVPADRDGVAGLAPREDAWALPASAVAGEAGEEAAAAAVPAGLGRIVAVAAAPGEGALGAAPALWQQLVEPRGVVRRAGWPADQLAPQFTRVLGEEGGAAPALPWLAAFVLGYVVVVGPVNALMLARFRRRELAWVTVPAVTVVFTVAAFFGVAGGRPPVGDAARVHAALDGQAVEVLAAQVRAPTEGARTIAIDGDGWVARPLVDGGQPATLERGGALRVVFELAALQPGGLLARRPVADAPPLELEAEQRADGTVAVTVVNAGEVALADVAVRAAGSATRVGELAPGARQTTELGSTSLRLVDPWWDVLDGLPQSPPGSLVALLGNDVLAAPGTVWATGVLEAAGTRPEVVIEGAPARDRGSLVAAGVTLRPAQGAPAGPFTVQRRAVAPDLRDRPGPLALEGSGEAFLRLRLPPADALERLRADLDRGQGNPQLEVWVPTAREWRGLTDAFPDGAGDPEALLDPLGVLWLRATGNLSPFDFSARTVHGLEPEGGET